MNKIEQIKDLKFLLDNGAVNQEQYLKLLNEIIEKTETNILTNDIVPVNIVEDKNKFDSVVIGNQEWMTENLNVKTFRNGEVILEARNHYSWRKAIETKTPAWCYYDNDHINGEKFGLLYNFYAVNDARGLAPYSWKIPLKKDFEILKTTENNRTLRSRDGWIYYKYDETDEILIEKYDRNGTNNSGFNLKPGGLYDGREKGGKSIAINVYGAFWTYKYNVPLLSNVDGIGDDTVILPGNTIYTKNQLYGISVITNANDAFCFGYSVRCLKMDISDKDPLFRVAAEIIVMEQQGSASLLQRKLKLGYNRASRLIDELEAEGIVGCFEGNAQRRVFISDLNELNILIGLPVPNHKKINNIEETIAQPTNIEVAINIPDGFPVNNLQHESIDFENKKFIDAKTVVAAFGLYDPTMDLAMFKFPTSKILKKDSHQDVNLAIEIQNNYSDLISVNSLIESKEFQESSLELPIILGKSVSDETFIIDLVVMPHLLILNNTIQEKSNLINIILSSFLFKKHPAELKLILIDPKKNDLLIYYKLERHYIAKPIDLKDVIITNKIEIVSTLKAVCMEINNRYSLFSNAICNDIIEYNNKFKERKLNPDNGHRFLPYIVIVINDFDYLTTEYSDYETEIEVSINQIIDKAKQVGIHLIITLNNSSENIFIDKIATSNSSENNFINKIKDKITNRFNVKLNSETDSNTNDSSKNKYIDKIKEEITNRINFKLIAETDSNTNLDTENKEQMISKELIFSNGNIKEEIHCAFLNKSDTLRIIEFIGSQKAYATAYIIPA